MKHIGGTVSVDTKVTYIANVLVPLSCVAATVAFTIAVFCQQTYSTQLSDPIEVFCTANGSPRIVTESQTSRVISSHWDPSLFLSVTFGFGRFTYAAAKGIDICWDLAIGRIGQLLLALLAYPTLRRSLLRYMEQYRVPYSVWSTFAFDRVSIAALWTATCSLFTNTQQHKSASDGDTRRCNLLFSWRYLGYFVILAYILGFSTIVSIMTGYQTAFIPYVRQSDNLTLIELSQLEIPSLVIVDGSRVGLNNYQPIEPGDPRIADIRGYADKIYANLANSLVDCFDPRKPHEKSWIPCNLDRLQPTGVSGCGLNLICGQPKARPEEPHPLATNTINEAGILTSSNITINGKIWSLPAPPLDIVAQPRLALYGADSHPRENYLSHGNVSYSSEYLQDNVICQPAAYYQWGFSSLLLLLFCLLTILFVTTLTILHEDTFWNGKADRFNYDVNHYRDAVDLVMELENNQISVRQMSARALREDVQRKNKSGICFDTQNLPYSRREDLMKRRIERSSRIRTHGPVTRTESLV